MKGYEVVANPLRHQLARLTLEHRHGEPVSEQDAIDGLIGVVRGPSLGLPGPETVTPDDVSAGLLLVLYQQWRLDCAERDMIEAGKDRGMTWHALGAPLGRSAQAMQQRYKRLGGEKSWASSQASR